MAALLVSIAVMGILMSVAMPVWRHDAQREKEAELLFRAGQVVHAVELWKRRYAGQNPPNLDVLVQQKFLRKKYKDPMTKDGEWRIITPAELQGTPIGGAPLPGMPNSGRGGIGGPGSSSGFGSSSDPRNSSGGTTGFGNSSSGPRPPGLGGSDQPSGFGSSPSSSTPSSSSSSQSGSGNSNSILPTLGAGGQTQYNGPVATVASRSKEHSIRIFKGRDRYDQWIVTIDDVRPRTRLQQQQPGQQPNTGQPNMGGPTSSNPLGSSRPPR